MAILNIQPRDYQKAIFETAKNSNTLVVLPTGLGKTLISLLLAVERKYKFPQSKILFLAPTKPLIEQHYEYFTDNLPELFADLQLFTGAISAKQRQKIWQSAEIIFSTPQCVANDLNSFLYDLKEVSLLIIDEAHRCVKDYDYTKVVDFYKRQAQNIRILGLTASPGSDSQLVSQICSHLNIEEIELRSRDSEDVKPYLQTLDFVKIEVPFPSEFMEIRVLLKKIWNSKINSLQEKGYISPPVNKITLLKLQNRLFAQLSNRDFKAMYGVSLTAQAIKISHALELLETQTLSGLDNYLQSLVKQAQAKKSKGVQTLVNSPEFQASLISLQNLLKNQKEHPKISKVQELISQEIEINEKTKIIIFTQFRETAQSIVKKLSQDSRIKSSVFVGQAKKKSSSGSSSGLSQKEQKSIIDRFKSGEINVLVATSIGEEGLDIPEVNAVIFYEPIPSAIRKIQRAGRTARLAPGKIFTLITQDTRDVAHHYAAASREKKMYNTISSIKNTLKKESNKTKTILDF